MQKSYAVIWLKYCRYGVKLYIINHASKQQYKISHNFWYLVVFFLFFDRNSSGIIIIRTWFLLVTEQKRRDFRPPIYARIPEKYLNFNCSKILKILTYKFLERNSIIISSAITRETRYFRYVIRQLSRQFRSYHLHQTYHV